MNNILQNLHLNTPLIDERKHVIVELTRMGIKQLIRPDMNNLNRRDPIRQLINEKSDS